MHCRFFEPGWPQAISVIVLTRGTLDVAARQVADLGTGDRRVSGNTAASSGQPNAVTGDRKTTTLTESPRQISTLTGG
jgi:hypothetical protein